MLTTGRIEKLVDDINQKIGGNGSGSGGSIDYEALASAIATALDDSLGTMGRPLWVKSVTASLVSGVAIIQCGEDTCNATRIRVRFVGLSSPDTVLAVGYGLNTGFASAVAILRPFDEFVDDIPAGRDICFIMFEETGDGDYQEAVGGINDYVQVSYYA